MHKKDRLELYSEALLKWGKDAQIKMVLEELAELQVAICKLDRVVNGIHVMEVIDEIADVEIMLEQLKFIYSLEDHQIETAKTNKLKRLKGLVK